MPEETTETETVDETTTATTETTTEPDHKAEAEKWKALARKHEGQAKANADAARKLKEIEDADKTEADRAKEAAAEAAQRAEKAEGAQLRLDVALDKAPEGMTIAQVRKLAKRLSGSNREELEADAAELFADFTPATGETEDDTSTRRTPRERLRSGAAPSSEPEETDPRKLADLVPRD